MSLITYFDYLSEKIPEKLELYKQTFDKRFSKTVSVMTHRVSISDFLKHTEETGVHFEQKKGFDETHFVTDSLGLGDYWRHEAGLCYVQESSAASSVPYMPLQQGDVVLDMCSSPGGKTSQIMTKLATLGGGYVVAHEIDPSRHNALFDNLTRIGARNAVITGKLDRKIQFDHILVDAPCSGEGTCYRDTEFMKDWSVTKVQKAGELSKSIISDAAKMLKPGGTLTYSTCTLNEFENERVVQWFLDHHTNFEFVPLTHPVGEKGWKLDGISEEVTNGVVRFYPWNLCGGFFVAQFRKKGNVIARNEAIFKSSSDLCDSSSRAGPGISETLSRDTEIPGQARDDESQRSRVKPVMTSLCDPGMTSRKPHPLEPILLDQFGIQLSDYQEIFTVDGIHYLTATGSKTWKGTAKQIGMPIAQGEGKNIRFYHWLGSCLGQSSTKNQVELVPEFIVEREKSIEVDAANGWKIVTYQGIGLTCAKVTNGELKIRWRKFA